MTSLSDFIDSLRLSSPNRKVNNSKERCCEGHFNKVTRSLIKPFHSALSLVKRWLKLFSSCHFSVRDKDIFALAGGVDFI